MIMTTQKQVRQAFWQQYIGDKKRIKTRRGRRYAPQNHQPADVRAAFVEFVDYLARDGRISEDLASRVTL